MCGRRTWPLGGKQAALVSRPQNSGPQRLDALLPFSTCRLGGWGVHQEALGTPRLELRPRTGVGRSWVHLGSTSPSQQLEPMFSLRRGGLAWGQRQGRGFYHSKWTLGSAPLTGCLPHAGSVAFICILFWVGARPDPRVLIT